MKALLILSILTISTSAFAGTWECSNGLDGKIITNLKMTGTETQIDETAAVTVIAGTPAGSLSVRAEESKTDELARLSVGAESPYSHLRVRVMSQPLEANVYPSFVLLVNFPIPQELEGTCRFSP